MQSETPDLTRNGAHGFNLSHVHIRPAAPDDAEPIRVLLHTLDVLHAERIPHLFQIPPDKTRHLSHVHHSLKDGHHFVALLEDQLIAYINLEIKKVDKDYPFLKKRCFGMIGELIVHPDFQKLGVGKKLVQAAEGFARARGAEDIRLQVYGFNENAHRFYQQLGYENLAFQMSKRFK